MPRRNLNNTGSIRKRSDGRYEGRYSAPDGTQRSVYGLTFTDCQAKLKAAIGAIDGGKWVQPTKLTVSDWIDIWLADYQMHTSARTLAKYKSIANQYRRSIGNVKLTKLSALNVRHMVTTMQNNGLSAATIRLYVQIFKTTLNCAVESGLIADNPADNIKLPAAKPRQFVVIDRAEIPAFVAAAQRTKYGNELITMLLTGLRGGELRGLKWSDIDFDAGTMKIQRQLQPTNGALDRFTPPKYGEIRLLHLPAEEIDVLRAQRRKQATQRLKSGIWTDDEITTDLVFRQTNGKAHTKGTISRTVSAVGSAIGKPDLHPHDLRHSYAVAALRSGASVKTVQHNLGHKSAEMTLDVYAAYTEDAGKTDAAKFSNYLTEIPPINI